MGINLAWLHFAQDLDDFDHALFAKAMNDTAAAGGNAVRWWLHTNASQNPIFDNGIVTGYNEPQFGQSPASTRIWLMIVRFP